MLENKIDFVLFWVNGADPLWRSKFSKYKPEYNPERYRDWDLLRYWFRGVEKYATWVNKVHFITDNQCPEWINQNHPKLNLVNHTDYIPKKYLPTFNSGVIELNLHRINELSENFVLFNDDTFITNHIRPERFFYNEHTIRDQAVMNVISTGNLAHALINNIQIIHKYFPNKRSIIFNNLSKWFSCHYSLSDWYKNAVLLSWPRHVGFWDPHLPQAHLKSIFEEVWNKEEDMLDLVCKHKLRSPYDVTQYVMRYWTIIQNNFKPINVRKKTSNYLINSNNVESICKQIIKQNNNMMCINDSELTDDFEGLKQKVSQAFDIILCEKSQFEI